MAGSAVPTKIEHRSRGVVRTSVTITTDASGDASATVVGVGFGRFVGFMYNGGLDASATITLSDTKTGASIFVYTTGTEGTPTFVRPTGIIVDTAGAAITAATTAPNVNRDIYLAGKVSITVADGGNAETGVIAIIVDEEGLGDLALTV
jgi:hypothetical protein